MFCQTFFDIDVVNVITYKVVTFDNANEIVNAIVKKKVSFRFSIFCYALYAHVRIT